MRRSIGATAVSETLSHTGAVEDAPVGTRQKTPRALYVTQRLIQKYGDHDGLPGVRQPEWPLHRLFGADYGGDLPEPR